MYVEPLLKQLSGRQRLEVPPPAVELLQCMAGDRSGIRWEISSGTCIHSSLADEAARGDCLAAQE